MTGLSERSLRHTERPQVASVRGVSRGYNHHPSVMETADGEFPAHTQKHSHLPFFFSPAVCPSVLPLVSLPVRLAQAADLPSCVATVTLQLSNPTKKKPPLCFAFSA